MGRGGVKARESREGGQGDEGNTWSDYSLRPRPFFCGGGKTAWYNLFDYPQKSGDTGYLRTLLAYLTVFYPLHGCIFTYSIRVR